MTSQRLTALEATFLALESHEVPFVPGCVLELDRPMALPALRDRLEALVAEVPRYRQRIARIPLLAGPMWVDDVDFAIERHVAAVRVSAPGGARELDQLVAVLLSERLPRGHSPWRLWTVNGLAGGRGALIAIVHHTLVDGVAGVALLERLLRVAPEVTPPAGGLPREPRTAQPQRRRLGERLVERLRADLRGRAEGARRLLTEFEPRRHAAGLVAVLRQGLTPASDLGLGSRVSRERSFATFTVELEAAKAITRQVAAATLNDVALAVVAGALRRYLTRHGVDCGRITDARAMVPVNRHPRGERGLAGNRVALLLAPLPLDQPDPLQMLHDVASTTVDLKQRGIAAAGDMLVAFSDVTSYLVLATVLRVALRRRAFNIVVTNVPGPPVPLYLDGARITRFVPIVNLWPHCPIGVAIASYAGSLTMSVDADRAVFPDLGPFIDDLAQTFAALQHEAAIPEDSYEQALPSPSPAPAPAPAPAPPSPPPP